MAIWLGEKNMPEKKEKNKMMTAKRQVREVHGEQVEEQVADPCAHQTEGGNTSSPSSVGDDARERSRDEESDGQGNHVDASPQWGLGEVVAVLGQPDALQPDDQHELQPASSHGRQEHGHDPGRIGPDLE